MRSRLTVEQLRPGGVPGYLAACRAAAAWPGTATFCTEFGELNQVLIFTDDDAAEPEIPAAAGALRSVPPLILELHRHHGNFWHDRDALLFELRTYTPQPGRVQDFLAAMLAAMPVRERYSKNMGIWTSRNDGPDQVLHLWPYRDLQHRDATRAGVANEPSWQSYGAFAHSVLAHMTSTILTKADPWFARA